MAQKRLWPLRLSVTVVLHSLQHSSESYNSDLIETTILLFSFCLFHYNLFSLLGRVDLFVLKYLFKK